MTVPQWVRVTTSRQAHVGLPPGRVEEEHGREGFTGPASHRYRLHPPPSVPTTVLGRGFVVATFAPRPLETDPDALRLPFFHRNVDDDEVILYHRGELMSRAGIREGMLTFHPSGIHHGPQPTAVARAAARGPGGSADEVAINIDAGRPLVLTEHGRRASAEGGARSWSE